MAEVAAKPWWRETIETIVWALALALILRAFVVQAFWIPSGSMLPTLQVGDRVLVAKFWNWIQPPVRGGIYVFKYPVDTERDFIKRVIALPGETVDIKDGVVVVDGQPLKESYVKNNDRFTLRANDVFREVPFKVPPDMYFVLGDNRSNSQDSRYWGFVPKSYLYGPAFFRYWPVSRIGLPDR